MTATATARARLGVRHDIDWAPAVARVSWVSAAHRSAVVERAVAQRMLRCTERSFDQLCALGLPAVEGSEGPRYDLDDLRNVGLHSRTGLTEIEMAMRFVLGYMRARPEEVIRPRTWRASLRLRSDGTPVAVRPRRVFRPTPEDVGGRADRWLSPDGVPTPVDPISLTLVPGATSQARITSVGALSPVLSSSIRTLALEVIDSGLRWHYLPPSAELLVDEAVGAGMANCTVFAVLLERHLVAAGLAATVRRGWIPGPSSLDHAWVEVVDEDGVPKRIDPSLAVLATVHGFGTPAFRDLLLGSTTNRIIPNRAGFGAGAVVGEDDAGDRVALTCVGP